MAHYALLDDNCVVVQVITGKDTPDMDWELHYNQLFNKICRKTSYNTYGGKHLLEGTPFRKNYAGIGFKYDVNRDAFIPPKPYNSWILNESTCLWEPPIKPADTNKNYYWNEDTISWIEVNNTE